VLKNSANCFSLFSYYGSSHLSTYVLHRIMRFNRPESRNNPMPYEVRKVQDTSHLVMISIPKRFANWMQIKKGSLVKITFDSSNEHGNRVIVSKVYIDEDDNSSSFDTN
jgi:hypothetical protein